MKHTRPAGHPHSEKRRAMLRDWLVKAAHLGGLTEDGATSLLDEYDVLSRQTVLEHEARHVEARCPERDHPDGYWLCLCHVAELPRGRLAEEDSVHVGAASSTSSTKG